MKYDKYKKLLYKLAHKHKGKNKSVEDLMSEANEAFAFCAKRYDPCKSKFSTYLFHTVDGAMKSHVNNGFFFGERKVSKEILRQGEFNPDKRRRLSEFEDCSCNPERSAILKDWIEGLSEGSQFIIKIVLDTPDELMKIIREKRDTWNNKLSIKKYLVSLGWSHYSVDLCFKEIAEGLKNIV